MHQLDEIISAKQREWKRERTSLLIKLDHKQREITSLRKNVLEKNSEVLSFTVVHTLVASVSE